MSGSLDTATSSPSTRRGWRRGRAIRWVCRPRRRRPSSSAMARRPIMRSRWARTGSLRSAEGSSGSRAKPTVCSTLGADLPCPRAMRLAGPTAAARSRRTAAWGTGSSPMPPASRPTSAMERTSASRRGWTGRRAHAGCCSAPRCRRGQVSQPLCPRQPARRQSRPAGGNGRFRRGTPGLDLARSRSAGRALDLRDAL